MSIGKQNIIGPPGFLYGKIFITCLFRLFHTIFCPFFTLFSVLHSTHVLSLATHDSMTSVFEHLSRGDLDSALLDQDHTTLSPFLPYLAKLLQVVQGPHKVQIIRILHHSDLAPTLHRLFRDDFTEVSVCMRFSVELLFNWTWVFCLQNLLVVLEYIV